MALWSKPTMVCAKSVTLGFAAPLRLYTALIVAFQYGDGKTNAYNILWALVFGFATLNILGLVSRRFDPDRNRLRFGEAIAIVVVLASIALLAWEMLYLFHVLPIKLRPRY